MCRVSRSPTFGRPKMSRVMLLALTPSPHPPLTAPHLHVHVSQPLPQGSVLLLALLPLLLHLRAQRRVTVVHQFANFGYRRVGQHLYDGGDLRLEADAVRHRGPRCRSARTDARGRRCGARASGDPRTDVWPKTCTGSPSASWALSGGSRLLMTSVCCFVSCRRLPPHT